MDKVSGRCSAPSSFRKAKFDEISSAKCEKLSKIKIEQRSMGRAKVTLKDEARMQVLFLLYASRGAAR